MRLLLATGMEEIETDLKRLLKDRDIEIFDCHHRIAILDMSKKFNVDTVLISPILSGNNDIIKLIEILTGGKTRVMVTPGDMKIPDTREFIVKIVLFGVYDYIYDDVTPEKIIECLDNPRTRNDVPADWVEEAMSREREKSSRGEGITKGIQMAPDTPEPRKGFFDFMKKTEKPEKQKKPERQKRPEKQIEKPKFVQESIVQPEESPHVSEGHNPPETQELTEPQDESHPGESISRDPPEQEMPEGFVAIGRVAGIPSKATYNTVQEVVASNPRVVMVSGTRWIKELRREKALAPVPIIVVGDEDPSICMAAGADECVPALDARSIDLILARISRMKEAWAQAEVDGLTGCYTRKFLDTYLTNERRPCSILMCDLDHFKKVNDTYGHPAGDEVLRQFGQFLRNNVRQVDIVARYGGEEFVVVLPATIEQAVNIAEKICSGWRERIIETDSGVIYSTASVGVAGPDPNAVKHADKALYAAKESGRDRWVRFDQQPKKPEPIIPEAPSIINVTPETKDPMKGSRVRSSPLFKRKLIAPDVASLAADLSGKLVVVWNIDNYKKAETCLELAIAIGKVVLVEYDFTNPGLDQLMGVKVEKDVLGKKIKDIGHGLITLGKRLQPPHAAKMVSKYKKIAYLPAGNDLGVIVLSERYASSKVYSDVLRYLKGIYNTVIVDAEISREMPTTAAALSTAEVILIPVQNEEQVARYENYKGLFDADMVFCRPK